MTYRKTVRTSCSHWLCEPVLSKPTNRSPTVQLLSLCAKQRRLHSSSSRIEALLLAIYGKGKNLFILRVYFTDFQFINIWTILCFFILIATVNTCEFFYFLVISKSSIKIIKLLLLLIISRRWHWKQIRRFFPLTIYFFSCFFQKNCILWSWKKNSLFWSLTIDSKKFICFCWLKNWVSKCTRPEV